VASGGPRPPQVPARVQWCARGAAMPLKSALCLKHRVACRRRIAYCPAMIDGELFPTVFFMAVIGLIVFVALSQILLDKPE
jgi:hypothetical protein